MGKAQMDKLQKDWPCREQKTWLLPQKISVSDWADCNRKLHPSTSAEPGRWKTERTPYLRGIMDAFCDPKAKEITVMASSQVGKTEAMYNMLAYLIDQDPGPTLMVLPRETDARSVSTNRVLPMLQNSRTLKKHLPVNSDSLTKLEYHLDKMIVYFAGSNSPADLASRPIRYLFLDELDKFPKFSGKEADPIKLASERQKTFWNKKTVKVSTPTTREGYIFREYERSNKQKFYVPCPHCRKKQVLVFSQIKWPKDKKAEEIKAKQNAYYECLHCQKIIHDHHKPQMLKAGEWFSQEQIQSSHAGFWINSLYSPWLSFSDIASEFLQSKDHVELLMNFVNSWLGEVWQEKTEETQPEQLKKKARDYPSSTVPDGVKVLTAGVDVQKDHFYFVIRGWGLHEESWLILALRVESWEEVEFYLFNTQYESVHDRHKTFSVGVACIDSGYRTDEVYQECRKWADKALAIKGRKDLGGIPFKAKNIDSTPSGKPIPGGLLLWQIDTSHFKDKISRMVHAQDESKAQWHLHSSPSEEYLKQFCAEQKVLVTDKRTGRTNEEWRPVSSGAANHFLDCEVYAVAAAGILGVERIREEEQTAVQPIRERRREEPWINYEGRGVVPWINIDKRRYLR